MTMITGTIRSTDGKLFEGALIEAHLMNQMTQSPGLIGNNSIRTESNSYGRFWLELTPTDTDPTKPDNHYVFKIINQTTNYYYKQVPTSATPLNFDELPNYVAPDKRTPFFGGIGQTITLPDHISSDYSGLFSYIAVEGDGSTTSFTAPGKVHLVAVNGVVQNPASDYTMVTHNSIEFTYIPQAADVVLIQYKL